MTIKLLFSDNIRITNRKISFIFIVISVLLCFHFVWLSYYGHFGIHVNQETQSRRKLFEQFRKSDYDYRWTWACINDTCVMNDYRDGAQTSLQKCNMMCSKLQLWPMPSRIIQTGKKYLSFCAEQFSIVLNTNKDPVENPLKMAYNIFVDNILMLVQETSENLTNIDKFVIKINVRDLETTKLSLDTDEGYILTVHKQNRDVVALIAADNFFGARHSLETLSQLIWFDNVDHTLNVVYNLKILDRPSFPYRGLMVDTARNYFPVSLLTKVLDGMAANKLNVFHWHITDAQSFPFEAPRNPNLAKYGSFSPSMVYKSRDIKYVVKYAKLRGIRVLMEVDAPSHTLKGWQEIQTEDKLVLPDDLNNNGQLNPENQNVLKVLNKIYRDILSLTDEHELFHLGGDEVNLELWENLTQSDRFYDMSNYWASYMKKMIGVLKRANNGRNINNVILWSSPLMESYHLRHYVDLNKTIVQYWYGYLEGELIANGLRVIFSNVEYWYLDCGFGDWKGGKGEGCGPYRTWQTIYTATPWRQVLRLKNVLGGEVCMWTEQVGEDSLETRIWPRSAAFAERVWTNPPVMEYIPLHVYTRLDTQRERMSTRNIKSEVLWSRYCTMNPSKCK